MPWMKSELGTDNPPHLFQKRIDALCFLIQLLRNSEFFGIVDRTVDEIHSGG